MERWLGAAPSSDAPGAGRSGAEARGARRGLEKKVGGRTEDELKGVRASTLKRLLRSPFSGSPGFKIHLRYIKIHPGYMYSTGYTQDTSRYNRIRIRYAIGNPTPKSRKPHRSRSGGAGLRAGGGVSAVWDREITD